jgi:FKBP-type peptidyl-prolyl cis-trans isomerase SlyD
MSISINKMVTLSYTLRADEKGGEIIEQTTAENPLKFIFGAGLMLPMFESNLTGMKQGESFEMNLKAADAYGELDEQAIVDLPKDIFIIDGTFDSERFAIGSQIPMQTSSGQRMNGTVLEVAESSLKMDFNHPLAGVDLFFEGEILEVREATEDELASLSGCGCSSGCGCGPESNDCSSGGCCDSGSCGC